MLYFGIRYDMILVSGGGPAAVPRRNGGNEGVTMDGVKLTEDVMGLARAAVENAAVLPILADAVEEAGAPALAASLRDPLRHPHQNLMRLMFENWGQGFEGCFLENAATAQREVEAAEARAEGERLKRFRETAFGRCGVVGCVLSHAYLKTRVTRKRPRGSGSKDELARRLADRLDELADRRWTAAKKGQRRPTPKQAAGLLAQVRRAVELANGRCDARTLDAADVVRCAARADATRTHSVDGGRVTANSYKYPWTTTAASATRLPDGTIRVRVSRDGRDDTVTAPARWWVELAAKASDVLNG